MELDRDLVKQFASVMKPQVDRTNTSTKMYGVVSKIEDGVVYVILDGSELETPAEASVDCKEDDRVIVQIRNHKAYISDNFTAPPSGRVADKYFQFTSDGMVIGRIDPETDAPVGNYILITDTDYRIMSEDGDVLAIYANSEVHLGYDSERAIIYLCDDSGRIYYQNNVLVLTGTDATGIRSIRTDGGSAQVAVAANNSQLATSMEVRNDNGVLVGALYISPSGVSIRGSAVEVSDASGNNAGRVVTANAVIVEGKVRLKGKINHGDGRRYAYTLRSIPSGYKLAAIRRVYTNHNKMLRLTEFGVNGNEVYVKVYNAAGSTDYSDAYVDIYWLAIRCSSATTVDDGAIDLGPDYDPN